MHTRRVLTLATACTLVAVGIMRAQDEGGCGGVISDIQPFVQWAGATSKVATTQFVLIRNEREWRELWADHTGAAASTNPPERHATPTIDFSRCMVLGFFRAGVTNHDGEIVESIANRNGSEVTVRFMGSTFQTADAITTDPSRPSPRAASPQPSSTSFGLWVIPRYAEPVVLEEGHRTAKGAPIQWKRVKRFLLP